MFAWWKRRKAHAALVEADATALMMGFGDLAYDEARRRGADQLNNIVIDGNRPKNHWQRVRRLIGTREGRDGLDTATRYDEDRLNADVIAQRLNRQARCRRRK